MDAIMRWAGRGPDTPFPHQLAFLLNNPIRITVARPARFIARLDLTGSERVLEVGPGDGYYSAEIAKRLPDGRLELFDVQPQMIDKARRKLERRKLRNIGYRSGDAGAGLPYPDGAFDVAFLALTIGEIPDKAAAVRELARVLRPGGALVFLESFPDPDRLSTPELRDLVNGAQFSFRDRRGSRWLEIVRFTRTADGPAAPHGRGHGHRF
ncbi:class I SAM-dependent methyltransferase [Millisia brevis]|uniref:class I SAM-dependent methyltransferase n=1 Tax=Millisia brevis TaxID=264148 RepID=UPI00082D4399